MTFDTLLAVLQQSEYDLARLSVWYETHETDTQNIEPENWTAKLRMLKVIASVLFFLPPLWRLKLGLWLTQPGEVVIRQTTYSKAKTRLHELRQKGLVVVAIAGSYGKTSTKHILQHTLNSERSSYMTPRSINTMLGISQIILSDLKLDHKIFLAEIGEYKPGQVAELMNLLQPDYGILTPVGHQHIELLGSFKAVLKEFSDFCQFFIDSKQMNHLLISDRNWEHFHQPHTYGSDQASEYRTENVLVSRAGTEFQITLPNQSQPLKVFMPLFGEHQAVNTLPSFWLATALGIEVKKVVNNLAKMPFITRRHEPIFAENNVLILDNSYNTNPDSVQDSLLLLNQLATGHKILVTAGFVEQGEDAPKVHETFGKSLVGKVDYLGLFSAKYQPEITKGFLSAGGKAEQILTGENQTDVVQKLHPFLTPGSVMVFEGGYQEIHS